MVGYLLDCVNCSLEDRLGRSGCIVFAGYLAEVYCQILGRDGCCWTGYWFNVEVLALSVVATCQNCSASKDVSNQILRAYLSFLAPLSVVLVMLTVVRVLLIRAIEIWGS